MATSKFTDGDLVQTDFYDLRWARAGLTVSSLADYINTSPRTIQRWEASGVAPRAVVLLLSLLSGDLSALPGAGERWAGWRLIDGVLITPQGETVTPCQINAMPYTMALAREYQSKARTERDRDLALALPTNVIPFPDRSRSQQQQGA